MRELNWHPDVQAAKLGHAGRVHQDASDVFASIHDGYAFQKLNGTRPNPPKCNGYYRA